MIWWSRLKNSLKLRFISNQLEIYLILLFGFIPLRIFSIYGLETSIRLILGLIFFLFFILARKKILPLLFNFSGFQIFLFCAFLLENVLMSSFLLLGAVFLWGAYLLPLGSYEFVWIFSSLLLLISSHFRFKFLILNPEFSNESLGLEKPSDLTWEKLISFLCFFTKKSYGHEVSNKLPSTFLPTAFSHTVRRFMFKRAFQHLGEHATAYGLIGGAIAGGGAAIGFGANYYQKDRELDIRRIEVEAGAKQKLADAEFRTQQARQLKIENDQLEKTYEKIRQNPFGKESKPSLGGWFSSKKVAKTSDSSSSVKALSVVEENSFFYSLKQLISELFS